MQKTAAELHDEWARGRGSDSPEENQAKRKAYQEALEAERKAAGMEETREPIKAPSSPPQAAKKKR